MDGLSEAALDDVENCVNTCKQNHKQCSGTRAHHWAHQDAGNLYRLVLKVFYTHLYYLCASGSKGMDGLSGAPLDDVRIVQIHVNNSRNVRSGTRAHYWAHRNVS